jgi:hypothetical protein
MEERREEQEDHPLQALPGRVPVDRDPGEDEEEAGMDDEEEEEEEADDAEDDDDDEGAESDEEVLDELAERERRGEVFGRFVEHLNSPQVAVEALVNLSNEYGGDGAILWAGFDHPGLSSLPEGMLVDLILRIHSENPGLSFKRDGYWNSTLLHKAAEAGLPVLIDVLVELNPDAMVTKDATGDLPIHRACWRLNLSTVPLLVKWNPATLKVANETGELPLHYVCERTTRDAAPPMLTMIEQLVEEFPDALWTRCDFGNTPIKLVLCGALDPPTPEFIRFLHRILDRGGWASETEIVSALHLACSYYPNPLLLGSLIGTARCTLDMKDKHGRLPLHSVCERYALDYEMPIVLEATQLLMEASPSAALDARDCDGATPFMLAVSFSSLLIRGILRGEAPPGPIPAPAPGAIPLLKEMFRRAPQSVRGTFRSGKTTALELVCQNRHCAELVSPVMESWPAALCFSLMGNLNDLPGAISSTVKSEARRMFLSLIEVLLHETTRWIVPDAIRERVREAVGQVVDIDCLLERGSFPVVQEIQKTVTGDALGQLRSEILKNDELQQLLQSHESLQDMVTGVYLMNKEGRLGCEGADDDPDTFPTGRHIFILEAAKDNLSCLFLHLRQCPTLFAGRDCGFDDEYALQRRGNERLAGFRAGRATRWRAGFAGRDAGARATGPRAGAPRRSATRRVLSWLARCSPRRWFAGEPGRVGVASRTSPFGRRRAKNRSSSVISS